MTLQTTSEVASEVRGIVAKKNLRQREIARALHMSPMQVSRRMTGKTSFTAEEMLALAQHLDVPVGVLYGESASVISTSGRAA